MGMALPQWMMEDMASMGINIPPDTPIPDPPGSPEPLEPPALSQSTVSYSQTPTLLLGGGEPPISQSSYDVEDDLGHRGGFSYDDEDDLGHRGGFSYDVGEDAAEDARGRLAHEQDAAGAAEATQVNNQCVATGVAAGEDAAEDARDGCNLAEESGAMSDARPTKRRRTSLVKKGQRHTETLRMRTSCSSPKWRKSSRTSWPPRGTTQQHQKWSASNPSQGGAKSC